MNSMILSAFVFSHFRDPSISVRINMPDYLTVCETAAREAGAILLDWRGRTSVRYKGRADLVTEADLASQEAIRRIVLGAFPDHSLLGEEDAPLVSSAPPASSTAPAARSEYRWIADPLDGTTNYVHGVPHFCVSLALERNGVPLAGAIFDPLLDECFTATAGGGARLNGRTIHTAEVNHLADALACTGFPPVVKRDSPELLIFLEAAVACQSVRRMGSAALNLCYLAAGRFDVLWAMATKIWDVAAGSLLVQEAGGLITAPAGSPFVLEDARFIAAANPGLHGELLQLVNRATEGSRHG
jgi:myo-inositol-1(or 4)-monophosphatase